MSDRSVVTAFTVSYDPPPPQICYVNQYLAGHFQQTAEPDLTRGQIQIERCERTWLGCRMEGMH